MTPIEQAFEAAYLRGRDPKSPITIDALLRGADGQYFHQHMRTYFEFFEAGFDHGMAVSAEAVAEVADPDPCAGGHLPIGWTGTVLCEVCGKKLGDEPAAEDKEPLFDAFNDAPAAPAGLGRCIDPVCDGCSGKGDGHGNECPRCWELPF